MCQDAPSWGSLVPVPFFRAAECHRSPWNIPDSVCLSSGLL